ncbi:MAG: PstS family phosphate ABC transporter substrate-binding protein [Gemmatimonadetes bacterium]|nr:PstS family phosphate ABC transporter substrate-binding protein [Gemmatimonadota bacterium]NNK63507.1 PstS family phosphate ABC transporter substrate-binding protein [Gemmatimonadota bacterium]
MISRSLTRLATFSCALLIAACGGGEPGADAASGEALAGEVLIDGSSTVFPIAEAIAEEFQINHPRVRVSVGFSGSGGGFERFCNDELDLTNASRPIRDSEVEACADAGIEFTELPVAWDGLSVIANPENDFLQCLTIDDLSRIWEPNSQVTTWRDVQSEWPEEEIDLYGPGTDSGTFDYFTETVNGESGASRPDYQASEDDNILVQGVAGDRYALGYLGYAYYLENSDKLKIVAVDGGNGCVAPSDATIADGSYAPLSRPLFIYVKHAALARPEVKAYMEFLVENAQDVVPATGYHALTPAEYAEDMAKLAAVTGG